MGGKHFPPIIDGACAICVSKYRGLGAFAVVLSCRSPRQPSLPSPPPSLIGFLDTSGKDDVTLWVMLNWS